jgi:hypothetical protein
MSCKIAPNMPGTWVAYNFFFLIPIKKMKLNALQCTICDVYCDINWYEVMAHVIQL